MDSCHICGSTNPAHLSGVASGRADIDGERRGDDRAASEAMATFRRKIGDVPGEGTAMEREGAWWVGYYHGRRTERLDLVGVLDIAERAGVTRDAVQKWRNRYPDFPAIEATISDYPVWRWDEVEAWLRATGRHPA